MTITLKAMLIVALYGVVAHAAQPPSPPPPADAQEIGPDTTAAAVDGQKWTVYYGAGNKWTSISGSGIAPFQCNPQNFGGDPAPNVPKKCFVVGHSRGALACAADFKNCDYSGDGKIIYGTLGKLLAIDVKGKGSVPCQPATFKGDPVPNVPKFCFFFADPAAAPQQTAQTQVVAATPQTKPPAAPQQTAPTASNPQVKPVVASPQAGSVTAAPSPQTKPVASSVANNETANEAKDKPPKTATDPAVWVIEQVKKRKALPAAALSGLDVLLTPAKGVFLIEESDEDEGQEKQPGAIIAVKGSFNWVRGFAASQGSVVGMAKIAKNMGYLVKKLGVSDTVPMEVTLFNKGDGLDLEFAFKIFEGWRMTGELFPIAQPRAAFKELTFKMHAKLPGKAPEFSMEAEGVGFAQPTKKDDWVALSPAVEVNQKGELTFGGAFSGTCSAEPNKDTEPSKDCKGDWDVFKLGRISAKGGSLRITMEGEAPRGIEASILNGHLGPPGQSGGIVVTGAIRGDAELKPGFGLVLKTSGSPKLMDFLNFTYGPLLNAGGSFNPLHVLYQGLNKLPNPSLPLSEQADIIITPTGFVVEDLNYPDPVIYIKAKAASAGITINLDSNIKGDPEKILKGDIVNGLPTGYVKFTENNDGFNDGIAKVAGNVPGGATAVKFIMNNGFEFHSVSATVDVGPNGKGAASVTYKLFGSERSLDNIPVDSIFDPTALPVYFLNAIANDLLDPPDWMKKIPGAADALKAVGTAMKSAAAVGGDVANMGKDLVTDPKALGGDAVKLGKDALNGAEATGQAVANVAVDVGSAIANGFVSLFGGGATDNSKDLLNQHISPFGEGTLSIRCASEGGVCPVDGTKDVYYGADTRLVTKRGASGSVACNTSNFGGQDPAPGTSKACYYNEVNGPAQVSVMCALEGQPCQLNGTQDVAFGAGNQVIIKRGLSGTINCSNSFFGWDPAVGSTKGCYYKAVNLTGKKCAEEAGNCVIDPKGPPQDAFYGGAATYTILRCQTNTVTCTNSAFQRDPARALHKACYVRPSDPAFCKQQAQQIQQQSQPIQDILKRF